MSLLALIQGDLEDATSWRKSNPATQHGSSQTQIVASQSQSGASQNQIGSTNRFFDNGHILRVAHQGQSVRLALIDFMQQDKVLEAGMHDGTHRVMVQFPKPSLRQYVEAHSGLSITQLRAGTTLELQGYHVVVRPQANRESRLHIIAGTISNTTEHVELSQHDLVNIDDEPSFISSLHTFLKARSAETLSQAAKSDPWNLIGHVAGSSSRLSQETNGSTSSKDRTSASFTLGSVRTESQHARSDDVLLANGVNLAGPQARTRTTPMLSNDINALLGLLSNTTSDPKLHTGRSKTNDATVQQLVTDYEAPASQVQHNYSTTLDIHTQLPGRKYTQEAIDVDGEAEHSSQGQINIAPEAVIVGHHGAQHCLPRPQDLGPSTSIKPEQEQSPVMVPPARERRSARAEEDSRAEAGAVKTADASNPINVSQKQPERTTNDSSVSLSGRDISVHKKNFNFVALLDMIAAETPDIPDDQMTILAKSYQYPHPPFHLPAGNVPVKLLTHFNELADHAAAQHSPRSQASARQVADKDEAEDSAKETVDKNTDRVNTSDEDDQPYPWSSSPAPQVKAAYGKSSSSLGSPPSPPRAMATTFGSTLPPDSSAVVDIRNGTPSRTVSDGTLTTTSEPQDPRQVLARIGNRMSSQSQGRHIPGLPLLNTPDVVDKPGTDDVSEIEDSSGSSDIEMDVPQALPTQVVMVSPKAMVATSAMSKSQASTPTSTDKSFSHASVPAQDLASTGSSHMHRVVGRRSPPRQLVPNTPNTDIHRSSGVSLSSPNNTNTRTFGRVPANELRHTYASQESITAVNSSLSKRALMEQYPSIDRSEPPPKRQRQEEFNWDRQSQVEDPRDIRNRMRAEFLKQQQSKVVQPPSTSTTPIRKSSLTDSANASATQALSQQSQNSPQAPRRASQPRIQDGSSAKSARIQPLRNAALPLPPNLAEPRSTAPISQQITTYQARNLASSPREADPHHPRNNRMTQMEVSPKVATTTATRQQTVPSTFSRLSSPSSDSTAARPIQAPTPGEATLARTSTQRIFHHFKSVYPAYKGDQQHFLGLCSQIRGLTAGKILLHRSLWDDFIIRHMTDYVPFQVRLSYEGKAAPAYETYYHDEVDEPLYTERVMNPQTLAEVLSQIGQAATLTAVPAPVTPKEQVVKRANSSGASDTLKVSAVSPGRYPDSASRREEALSTSEDLNRRHNVTTPLSLRNDTTTQQCRPHHNSAASPARRKSVQGRSDAVHQGVAPIAQREYANFTIAEEMVAHVESNLDDVRNQSLASVNIRRLGVSGKRTIDVWGTARANMLAISLLNNLVMAHQGQLGRPKNFAQTVHEHEEHDKGKPQPKIPLQADQRHQPATAGIPGAPTAPVSFRSPQVSVGFGHYKNLTLKAGSARKRDAAHDDEDSPRPPTPAIMGAITTNKTSAESSNMQKDTARSLPWQKSTVVTSKVQRIPSSAQVHQNEHPAANGRALPRESRPTAVTTARNLHGQGSDDMGYSSQSNRHQDWWRDNTTPFNDFARNFVGARSYPHEFGSASAIDFNMARANTGSTRTRKGIDPLAWHF